MTRAPQAKAVIVVGMLFFLVGKACPQISILSKPVSGGVEMSEVSQWGGYVQNFFRATGVSPDYYAYRILPMPGSTGIYSGSALASKGLVSGAIGISPSYGVTLRGGSSANSAMDIFADVVPGSKVRVKINANMSINWGGPIMDNRVGFGFDALVGEDGGDGLSRVPLLVSGGLSRSTLCVSEVSPPATPKQEEGGKTYYKIGTISLSGVGGIESPNNLAVFADYNVEIGAISAQYIGPALEILDGNSQTWIVGRPLPKALVVKVADGETGAL
ncbi:MAG TPA: hypothetical protein DCZ93_07875, partial [Elusimicrobia bacterium]|nr:hypothetical protein [Elusimicrobiota bacterium]